MTKGKGGGRIFGKDGPVLLNKDIGRKMVPGQGLVAEDPDPSLSRQQRRRADRLKGKGKESR